MSDIANRNNNDSSMDFDALAELFLGETESEPGAQEPAPIEVRDDIAGTIGISRDPEHPAPEEPAPPQISVEALVMGHLPVRTGPWLSQYAATIARTEEQPVGMIRLGESESRVDVFGLDPSRRLEQCSSFEDALRIASTCCQRWMLQVGDLDVPGLLRSSEVQAITLLAGGNEAAVVDAYRTIKSLVAGASDEESEPNDADIPAQMPDLRLAIMGADHERAETVASRLREASRAFLGREIELAAGVSEMGPTGATPLFRGRTSMSTQETLEGLRREPHPVVESKPTPIIRPRPVGRTETPPEPAPVPETPVTIIDEPNGTRDRVPPRGNGMPTRSAWPGGLPLHVAGLTPIDVPYPDDPAIEFAIDAQARLHVLRFEAGESGAAVSSLTAAAGWAARHVALINLAIAPKGPIRLDASTALHLFTSRPTAVRPLIDADVRLHALAPVPTDRDWIALDLN